MKRMGTLAPMLIWAACQVQPALAREPEPMRTSQAAVGSGAEVRLWYEAFNGVELDEAEEFDGWSATAEASVSFGERYRLRLTYPFKTDGDAIIKEGQGYPPDTDITIEGNGGVYDFLTFTFEHQLFFAADRGYNLGYYLGGGTKADRLDTTKYNPEDGRYDFFNHTGSVFHGGVKFDRVHGFGRVLANAGIRYYWSSDDIYPGGNKDSFLAVDLRGAVVFQPWGAVHPAVELTYLGDFSDFNQLTLLPELLWSVGDHVDLKAGATIGLGGTGSQYGGQAEIAVHF
ncbi:MAG TPA: hypothetical protein ENJ98_02475 [Thiolapillus brandeum]|uniref:Uncharacterized protein n=1 Tax=Thiolapillus brandeum TaxID=1076588 RepID=A0A7C5IYP6_9GAMM|nr:hypothetical protein [Thiolapillus brandeum]